MLVASAIWNVVLGGCAGGGGGTSNNAPTPVTVTGRAYSGAVKIVTRSDGSIVTNNAVSSPVTWAADHGTKTTAFTFADGATNPVSETVAPTVAAATYGGSVQTIVTTYGDGATSTATNSATSNAVSWATDHVTRTTTYAFANGGINAVVATVPGTPGTPGYSGSVQTILRSALRHGWRRGG